MSKKFQKNWKKSRSTKKRRGKNLFSTWRIESAPPAPETEIIPLDHVASHTIIIKITRINIEDTHSNSRGSKRDLYVIFWARKKCNSLHKKARQCFIVREEGNF